MGERRDVNESTPHDLDQPLDRQQFAALVTVHYRQVWIVAAALTGDRGQADDVVQEAAMIAWQKRASFSAGTNFRAWLVQIVRKVAANHSRKVRHRRTVTAESWWLDRATNRNVESTEIQPSVGPGGLLKRDQSAFDDHVVAALNGLANDVRCCVLLKVVQDLTYAEIAEILQIPEGTAMSHVHRGKRTMRERLRLHLDPLPTKSTMTNPTDD